MYIYLTARSKLNSPLEPIPARGQKRWFDDFDTDTVAIHGSSKVPQGSVGPWPN